MEYLDQVYNKIEMVSLLFGLIFWFFTLVNFMAYFNTIVCKKSFFIIPLAVAILLTLIYILVP